MIAGDRQNTNIRSSASVPVKNFAGAVNYRNVTINVDARPYIMPNMTNAIRLQLGLEYQPRISAAGDQPARDQSLLSEQMTVILESGKPLVVSQAADPVTDRKIIVEVVATIVK